MCYIRYGFREYCYKDLRRIKCLHLYFLIVTRLLHLLCNWNNEINVW